MLAPKWWNFYISGPMVVLNIIMYAIYGSAISLVAIFFCLSVAIAGFLVCDAMEKMYNE